MSFSATGELPGNPLHALTGWLADAEAAGERSPRTMTFATADDAGRPHARTVLTTVIDDEALYFHSSRQTTKIADIAGNPHVSGVFHWPLLARQVSLQGAAHELPRGASEAAYSTRPRRLQLLAWLYDELSDGTPAATIDPAAADRVYEARAEVNPLPMPPSWTTIRVVPEWMAFWVSHAPEQPPIRVLFERSDDGTWRHRNVVP